MTSSNGNIFRIAGRLCGEFTGHQWIPRTKPVTRSFDVFFIYTWINGWVNNHEAGDLRCHHTHYDVNVMICSIGMTSAEYKSDYRQISNIRRTLLDNKLVVRSDVIGASPAGAAPTTSSFST